ncbi:MAG: TaqI-like C-terminal specificity domain-containing protein [Desulfuromonadaceae bacterium]|nr:TaqI-like C-terminal specificity domain-containing protein [Desulfuromonadaceae bacterium]MDD2854633.1 TaqI-like C-terminal specificity domain-containing protein [Desulfuromonadaceae bacterium]
MKLSLATPAKSLGKAYLKQSLKREQVELFKLNLTRMFERIRTDEHEEHLKNILSDFLKDTWYKQTNEINTSGRADLAIHNGTSSTDSVGVLIEVKRPTNRNEMISADRPNTKALHELLHYYMQERYIKDNKEIRHLIVSNIYEWYIFDAVDFERFFFQNQRLVKSYRDWNDGLLVSTNTDWFYQEIAKPFIEKELDELPCTCFNLKEYERILRNPTKGEDNKLIALYKILSPTHLLKQTFANDSNSLNREFYSELLHILGLEEVKEKGKKLISRKPEGKRNEGSLLENTCNFLKTRGRLSVISNLQQYGADLDEQCFSVALELCITWLNRLLFLKLLEGQLIGYHAGDRSYAFLNSSRIEDFDELNELFFEVLAVRIEERSESVCAKFGNIPYLNSSLFEESDLERSTMRINELKNRLDLPLHASTVLKGANGKRLSGSRNTLNYLFDFLDAYDFGAEGSADIQEQNKSIINASVLGLIFEKINGYKDGSFFTPGFITMYICRETIRRAVLGKFNETYGWSCENLTELHNDLYRQRIPLNEANALVNSLKICDPAVGSGHFLVSALNEIIAVKSELRILADSDGKLLRCDVTVENDELIVTVDDQIFEYHYKDAESQRVQETFFHEKESIIENCLFGVDINPKSVAICRLRLWIELLKNAYYRKNINPNPPSPPYQGGTPLVGGFAPPLDKGRGGEGLQLETLPNIDINIKCGNSLVSRFAISGNPNIPAANRKKLKELTDKYRELVWAYKQSPSNKALLRKEIDNLKHSLENFGLPNDKDLKSLWLKKEELSVMTLFGFDQKEMEKRQKLHEQLAEMELRFAEKEKLVYHNAFEWRFEFPEVLDNEGEFVGFDAIIGNPPYGNLVSKDLQKYFATNFQHQDYQKDLYLLFLERYEQLTAKHCILGIIIPNTWLQSVTFRKIRQYMTNNFQWHNLLHLPENVFDAVVDTLVLVFENAADDCSPLSMVPIYVRKDGIINLSIELNWESIPKNGDSINIVADSQAQKLSQKIITSSVQLSVICSVFNGVKPFEKGKGTPPQTDQTMKEKPYVCDGSVTDKTWKPLLRGSLIQRYKILWDNNYWIQYGPWLAAPRDASIFEAPLKIMVRQTGDSIIAAMVEGGFIGRDNLHIILPKDETYSLQYILGVLNSKLADFVYTIMNPEKGEALAQVKKQHVEQLPIPPATDAQQAPIIELVQKILAAKQNVGANCVRPPLGGDADKGACHAPLQDLPDIPALEAEIDRLVYELYGLTDEEIAVVEGKP